MTSSKTFNLLVTADGNSKEDTLTVPAGETKTKTLQLIFSTPGERTYYAKVDGTTYAVGTIKVEDDDSSPPIGSALKITGFYYSPESPVEGGNVTFAVKIYNSIGNGISATLKLIVRDKNSREVVYSEEKAITPEYLNDSEYTFTWSNVKAGEYTAEAKVLYNGEVKDSEIRDLTVEADNDFTGILSANITNDVSVGVKARFTLTVRNDENVKRYSIPVRVYYVYTSPDDVWHSVIKVKEAEVDFDPLGEYQDWFDFTFANPGTYKFYLVVNSQEEDEKVIRVNLQGSISAVMTCSPEFVTEDVNSVSCHVDVENLGSTTEDIWITNIYFAGGEIYDKGSTDNLMTPSPSSLTLNAYSTGAFTFTIPINDELQEGIPVDLSDINPGTPIAIKTYLNTLQEPTMFVIEMNPRDFEKDIHISPKEVISVTIGVGKAVWNALKENPKSVMTVVSSIGEFAYTAGISWLIQTWTELC